MVVLLKKMQVDLSFAMPSSLQNHIGNLLLPSSMLSRKFPVMNIQLPGIKLRAVAQFLLSSRMLDI